MVTFVASSGKLGVTMLLSLTSDILSLFTIHLYVCYLGITAVFRLLLTIAGSMWNLFRGQHE
jgi:phosphatidylinositol N-acetylglucosaminyltransferase subunit Q